MTAGRDQYGEMLFAVGLWPGIHIGGALGSMPTPRRFFAIAPSQICLHWSAMPLPVHAVGLVAEAGYAIGNADVTIICEAPRIGPHREAMRMKLAELMCVDMAVTSVKATTTEGLGFTGRREGIAAQAAVSLIRV